MGIAETGATDLGYLLGSVSRFKGQRKGSRIAYTLGGGVHVADLSPEVSKSILEPARALKNVSYGFSLEISGYLWEIGDYWKFFVPGTKGGFSRDLHSVPPMCIHPFHSFYGRYTHTPLHHTVIYTVDTHREKDSFTPIPCPIRLFRSFTYFLVVP